MREDVLVERLGNLQRNRKEGRAELLLQVLYGVPKHLELLLNALGRLGRSTAVSLHNLIQDLLSGHDGLDFLGYILVRRAPLLVGDQDPSGDLLGLGGLDSQLGQGLALADVRARDNC